MTGRAAVITGRQVRLYYTDPLNGSSEAVPQQFLAQIHPERISLADALHNVIER